MWRELGVEEVMKRRKIKEGGEAGRLAVRPEGAHTKLSTPTAGPTPGIFSKLVHQGTAVLVAGLGWAVLVPLTRKKSKLRSNRSPPLPNASPSLLPPSFVHLHSTTITTH